MVVAFVRHVFIVHLQQDYCTENDNCEKSRIQLGDLTVNGYYLLLRDLQN